MTRMEALYPSTGKRAKTIGGYQQVCTNVGAFRYSFAASTLHHLHHTRPSESPWKTPICTR